MLFELHIPKTGGTTLFSALSAAIYPGRWHVAMSELEMRERMTDHALLSGHFDWDVLAFFPEPPRVLTVLRDPVELALSAYGYWRAHAHEGIFSPAAQIGADEALAHSIDELLLDPNSRVRANLGIMTNFLAGKRDVAAGCGLGSALQHLESCAWVGTTATLDRDMGILPTMFGLRPIVQPARLLVTSDRPQRADVGRDAMRLLESLTQSDRVLYDRARTIAEEQQRRYA